MKDFVVNHYHQLIELCVRVFQLLINGAAYFEHQKLYDHHKLLGYIHSLRYFLNAQEQKILHGLHKFYYQ